jgi:hypothetical protein
VGFSLSTDYPDHTAAHYAGKVFPGAHTHGNLQSYLILDQARDAIFLFELIPTAEFIAEVFNYEISIF